jgi:cytochrome P450/NADPH-cytochrome P450 reductase
VDAELSFVAFLTEIRCSMDKRFNSFYREDMHPFVETMVSVLAESQTRGNLPTMVNMFRRSAQRKYDEEIAYMRGICVEMIAQRRKNPSDKKDLLNAMIHGKDPKTGCYMTDQSIVDNILTFLVAGMSLKFSRSLSFQLTR